MELTLQIDLRVICFERIRKMVEGEDWYNISDNASWAGKLYLPADFYRLTLAPMLLDVLKEEEEAAAEAWIETALPGAEVPEIKFEWSNLTPLDIVTGDPAPSEPPISLYAYAKISYVQPTSLASFFSESGGVLTEDVSNEMREVVTNPPGKRGLFGIMAYEQLLEVPLDPGWAFQTAIKLPPGYTFEYFNKWDMNKIDSLKVYVNNKGSDTQLTDFYVASITNRGLVTLFITILASILVAIFVLLGVGINHNKKKRKERMARALEE